jgi:hypothetical protein
VSARRGALARIGRNDEAMRGVNRLQRLAFVLQERPASVGPDESALRRAGFVGGKAGVASPSIAEMMEGVRVRAGRRMDRGTRVVLFSRQVSGRLVTLGQDGGGN